MPVIYTAEGVKPLGSDMMYGLQRAAQEYQNSQNAREAQKAADLTARYQAAAAAGSQGNSTLSADLLKGANQLSDRYNEERGGVYDAYGRRHENNIFAPGASDPSRMFLREQRLKQVVAGNSRAYNVNKAADYARNLEARRRAGENISDQDMADAVNAADTWQNIANAWKPLYDPVTGDYNYRGYDPGFSKPSPQLWYDYMTKQWLERSPQPIDLSRGPGTRGIPFNGRYIPNPYPF